MTMRAQAGSPQKAGFGGFPIPNEDGAEQRLGHGQIVHLAAGTRKKDQAGVAFRVTRHRRLEQRNTFGESFSACELAAMKNFCEIRARGDLIGPRVERGIVTPEGLLMQSGHDVEREQEHQYESADL